MEQLRSLKDQAESKTFRLENDIKIGQEKLRCLEERNAKLCRSIEEVQREKAINEGRRKRDQLALDNVRLGKISIIRTGINTINEIWEEGYALKELKRRRADILYRKEALEARKKALAAQKRVAKKTNGDDDHGDLDLELCAETLAIKSHFEQVKKDELAIHEEMNAHESEKAAHQKELKRIMHEDQSRFYRDQGTLRKLPCLKERYLFISLLGKGGFSEVWKALDLVELKEVAVKVHQLNPQWSQEKKDSYTKHVTREYTIHRDMRHPRVVQLFDVFEVDTNSFATVLEYCKGTDLDEKLKRCKVIEEKNAKAILLQIMCGLKYLNTPETTDDSGAVIGSRRISIIHFDLKPANILFDENGDAKITDFGLSKVIEEHHEGQSMELTSQGAGTYWYLPPECFARADNGAPRISNKVDVWSVGVIYYQMLYGKRPFGEGKSQERVLSEGIITNATSVEFPATPNVTPEAKDFISACLTHDQHHRPDVQSLCNHPYLRQCARN